MTKRIISSAICIVMLLTSVFSVIGNLNLKTVTKTSTANEELAISQTSLEESYCAVGNESCANMKKGDVHFLPDENISVSYIVSSNYEVKSFNYTQNGFEIISATLNPANSKQIDLILECAENEFEHNLNLEITLSSNETINALLFAVKNECGSFISSISKRLAQEEYFMYALAQGIMTQSEYEAIKLEQSKGGASEVIISENVANTQNENNVIISENVANAQNENNISTYASNVATFFSGRLEWKDDNNITHPLQGIKVLILNRTSATTSTILGIKHTDGNGRFSHFTVSPSTSTEKFNIYIIAYAGNDAVSVKESSEDYSIYRHVSSTQENISVGESVSFNITLNMEEDPSSTTDPQNYKGKAFQISQAMITANNYASTMIPSIKENAEALESVSVIYPCDNNNCYYSSLEDTIYINNRERQTIGNSVFPGTYAAWDVLMHEYGHHVETALNIIAPEAGGHHNIERALSGYSYIDENGQFVKYTKYRGLVLAWSESWATVFAIMAQNYYSSFLTNIEFVNDSIYTSYGTSPFNLENSTYYNGESCEGSVMAILFDIYDDTVEENDTIALGHLDYWEITAGNERKHFSDFIQDFYSAYPEYIDDISHNLSKYNIAAYTPSLLPNTDNAPTIIMHSGNSYPDYENNNFVFVFYDSEGNEVYRSEETGSKEYLLPKEIWYELSYGTYSVVVISKQIDTIENCITGPYISEKYEVFTKEVEENKSANLTISADSKYNEFTVYLHPGQYIEYTVSFESPVSMLIQTFGDKDTFLQIYNDLGTLLDSDNNSGYLSNALIYGYRSPSFDYLIRVKFLDPKMGGRIKLAIAPVAGLSTSSTDYYSASPYSDNDGLGHTTYVSPNHMRAITFNPSESGEYTLSINSDINMSIYLVDPSSSTGVALYADGTNPTITAELTQGIDYFIVVSASTPSQITGNTYFTLTIAKNTDD